VKLFTPDDREHVRARLLELAREDDRITGAALTGSAAEGTEDRWSDVDVFLGVADGVDHEHVLAEWSELIYEELGVLHHWDVRSGAAVYRVFLLPNCLQVDVAFVPAADFGARGPKFRTVFGSPVKREHVPPPAFDDLAGLGWLSILHSRASIERGRAWQAEYWVSSVRDQTLALACLRLGVPAFYAKRIHRLPTEVTLPLGETLVHSLEPEELRRALRAAARCFLDELRLHDPGLADRLVSLLEFTCSDDD